MARSNRTNNNVQRGSFYGPAGGGPKRNRNSYQGRSSNSGNSKVSKQTIKGPRPIRKRPTINKNILIAIVCIISVAAIFFGFKAAFGKNGYNIYLDGQIIGAVKAKELNGDDIIATVTAQCAQEAGANVKLKQPITIEPVHVKDEQTIDYVISQIRQAVTYDVEAAVIYADGAAIVTLSNKSEADTLLENIMLEYIPESSSMNKDASSFIQNVEVRSEYVDPTKIISSEDAFNKLVEGTMTEKDYTVKSGDNLYTIASAAGMTVDRLLEINPSITISTVIKVGDTIKTEVSVPFLSVKTVETQVYNEKEPKETKYQQDNSKPSSYKKVVQQGKDGQAEVTVQIVRVNGFVEENKVISRNIIEQPVDEIIVVGTQ